LNNLKLLRQRMSGAFGMWCFGAFLAACEVMQQERLNQWTATTGMYIFFMII
jgi:hypothetical protein